MGFSPAYNPEFKIGRYPATPRLSNRTLAVLGVVVGLPTAAFGINSLTHTTEVTASSVVDFMSPVKRVAVEFYGDRVTHDGYEYYGNLCLIDVVEPVSEWHQSGPGGSEVILPVADAQPLDFRVTDGRVIPANDYTSQVIAQNGCR